MEAAEKSYATRQQTRYTLDVGSTMSATPKALVVLALMSCKQQQTANLYCSLRANPFGLSKSLATNFALLSKHQNIKKATKKQRKANE